MGVFRPDQVARLKHAGIAWFACATTLDEARAAQAAGADAVVAQGPRPVGIVVHSMPVAPSGR